MEVGSTRNIITTEKSAFQMLIPKTTSTNDTSERKSSPIESVSKRPTIPGGNMMLQTQLLSKLISRGSTTIQDRGQGDLPKNDTKYISVSGQQGEMRTSAILVPVISATSGRNILEEMKRKVAQTLINQQQKATSSSDEFKSSLVPGTNVEYKTPGANHKNKNGRIKRPMNAFMVWARDFRSRLATSMPNATNSEISVKLGQIWAAMKPDDKKQYYQVAEKIKVQHRKDYPDWVYQPSAPGVKKKEEALNYGRTPSPPMNNQQSSEEPSSIPNTTSGLTGTPQTTIVVLSNDNKIHHTKLTTSQSLQLQQQGTTSPLSRNHTPVSSPGKVVPKSTGQNYYKYMNVIKESPRMASLNSPTQKSPSNHQSSPGKSAMQTLIDISKLQYKSALEIPEVNKVTDKTKGLLATKIISARPFDPAMNRENQINVVNNTVNVKRDIDLPHSSREEQSTLPGTTPANVPHINNQQNNQQKEGIQPIVDTLITKPKHSRPISENTLSTSTDTIETVHPRLKSACSMIQSPVVVSSSVRQDIANSATLLTSVATPKHNNANVVKTTVNAAVPNTNLGYTNVQLTNVLSRNDPRVVTAFNQVPRQLGLKPKQPMNIRPMLVSGSLNGASNNNVKFDQQVIRPKGPVTITVAESLISPATTPIRRVMPQLDSRKQAMNPGQTSVDKKHCTHQHIDVRKSFYTSKPGQTSTENKKGTELDEKQLKLTKNTENDPNLPLDKLTHKDDVGSSCVPSLPCYVPEICHLLEMTPNSEAKHVDDLWPFPFSDNPGDWPVDEQHCMYVEMIDPYDPFLGPDDMMSEMFPGCLNLNVDRWTEYMAADGREHNDDLEKYFPDHDDDDVNISPVPLKETLRRLVNIETQLSDKCDVITGDLIIPEVEESLDGDPAPKPAILTDDLARKLSVAMENIMTGRENGEVSESREQTATNEDSSQENLVLEKVNNSPFESEQSEAGRSDQNELQQCNRSTDKIGKDDHNSKHLDNSVVVDDTDQNSETYEHFDNSVIDDVANEDNVMTKHLEKGDDVQENECNNKHEHIYSEVQKSDDINKHQNKNIHVVAVEEDSVIHSGSSGNNSEVDIDERLKEKQENDEDKSQETLPKSDDVNNSVSITNGDPSTDSSSNVGHIKEMVSSTKQKSKSRNKETIEKHSNKTPRRSTRSQTKVK